MGGIIEQWKDIPEYENLYQVSNLGRIKSLYNYKRNGTNILVPKLKKGYYTIGLRKNGIRKWYSIHRLVAKAFIPNLDKLPQINHKDENKLNNNVDNLEWCSASYNNNYGTRQQRVSKTNKLRKQVYKYDLKGNLLETFYSLKEASIKEKKGISTLSLKCRNMTDYKGYIYSYKEVV